MSTYVEADVEQDAKRIEETLTLLPGAYFQHQSMAQQRLYRVKAAALEGAKVPGLVAQGLDMARQIGELSSEVSALQARVAELERERNEAKQRESQALDLASKAQSGRSAAQDRVAELEAKVTQAHAEWDAATDRATEAESERDALRAQVESLASAGERLEQQHLASAKESEEPLRTAYRYAAGAAKVLRSSARDVLSAPPAETTPATEKFDAVMEAVKLAQEAGLPVRFTPIPDPQVASAFTPEQVAGLRSLGIPTGRAEARRSRCSECGKVGPLHDPGVLHE